MEEQAYFYRDTWAEVDLDYISQNLSLIRQHIPEKVDIIAVVKANAYGHGDVQAAEVALDAGASYLAVAFMDEGIALRKKGIKAPILVLGATRPEDAGIAADYNLAITIFEKDWLEKAANSFGQECRLTVHIKIDTGMGRIGMREEEEFLAVAEMINKDPRFLLEGVFSHFATADELNLSYFEEQLSRFNEMVNLLDNRPKYVHCANSAAALRFPKAYFNAVRIGIAMYGLSPSAEIKPELPMLLNEAFALRTRLVQVKKLQKGDKVSYGAVYQAEDEEWIGTLPIGYADGWIRRLQGQEVLVDGKRSPIVGRICMDQCMIRLPYYLPPGTEVTLIGKQENEFISVDEIARKLDTINYEVPCLIASRVPRLYRRNGDIVDLNNHLLQN